MSDAISTFVPCPLLVNASSGTAAPPVPMQNFSAVLNDYPGADQRSANSTHLGTDYMVDDPNDLTQAGWAILFASDADPAIVRQLQPLIDLRSQQVQDPKLFKQFAGNDGVLPGETADAWARRHSVSLTAPVDPFQGVPYYVLIAGSPDRISFEFQAMLKMEWAVGRLHFDDIEDYGRYAQAVVQYESAAFKPQQRKNVALWTTRNNGDLATAMLSGAISMDFMSSTNPLGARSQFTLNPFTNEKATKPQFLDILRGNLPGGPPAVIFTGSHGSNYDAGDPALLRLQGALVSQEWKHGSPVDPNCLICGRRHSCRRKVAGNHRLFVCLLQRRMSGTGQLSLQFRWFAHRHCSRALHRASSPGFAQPRHAGHDRTHRSGFSFGVHRHLRNAAAAGRAHSAGIAHARQARRTRCRYPEHSVEHKSAQLAMAQASSRGPGGLICGASRFAGIPSDRANDPGARRRPQLHRARRSGGKAAR